jgi:hypothetical protein
LIAGTMPPRKPATRRSSRLSKLKEPELGEGSSLGVTKQLEYTLRPEPIIKTTIKKVFIQPPAFEDTEASRGTKETLLHCREIFKKINWEEYLEYIPHSDPDIRSLDDKVFSKIRLSYLHMVAIITPIFPCIEVLKWLIDNIDTHKCLINNDNGGCVGVF